MFIVLVNLQVTFNQVLLINYCKLKNSTMYAVEVGKDQTYAVSRP